MAARIFRTIVPVIDIDKGAAFYSALFGEPGERVSEERHYFDCGGVILACVQPFDHEKGELAPAEGFRPNPDHVYFSVGDLDAAYEAAETAGPGRIDDEIATQPWGERSFYLQDPFGNPLCFVDEGTVFTGAGQ